LQDFTKSSRPRSYEKKTLPIGVKCISFSYLPAKDVISTISMLSNEIRDYILTTELLDQERIL